MSALTIAVSYMLVVLCFFNCCLTDFPLNRAIYTAYLNENYTKSNKNCYMFGRFYNIVSKRLSLSLYIIELSGFSKTGIVLDALVFS